MDAIAIANLRTGIDRSRRFGVDGIDRLWSLVNAYVNDAGRVVKRPGMAAIPSLAVCRGLFGWKGKLQTFAHVPQANPSPAILVINVLRHPTGGAAALAKIHHVATALGALYVVAEFADGVVQHYWLQPVPTWTATTRTDLGEFMQPTAPNGFYYEVTNASALNKWEPNKTYAVGNQVQPTVYNGFYYQATATTGTGPKSGNEEPEWPAQVAATIVEVRLPGASSTTPTAVKPPVTEPPEPPLPGPGSITRATYNLNHLTGVRTSMP